MKTTLLVGIICAVCTLVSPVVAMIIKEQMDKRSLVKLTPNRQKALEGTWRAIVHQELKATNLLDVFPAILQFEVGRKTVKGRLTYDNRKRGSSAFLIKGGFYNDHFLKMEYHNELPHVVQFGVIILELSSNALLLQGRFLGFGPESEMLVAGTITAEKV